MTPNYFNVDDKVRHMSGCEGVVTSIDGHGVHVEFTGRPGLRGIYDARWFKMYPNGLEILSSADASRPHPHFP